MWIFKLEQIKMLTIKKRSMLNLLSLWKYKQLLYCNIKFYFT